jgi:hypothetical protein
MAILREERGLKDLNPESDRIKTPAAFGDDTDAVA